MITLRPYQSDLKQQIYNAWNSGARNVAAVLATGGGKSLVVSDIVMDKNTLGCQQVVIAHRVELVSQMSLHIGRRGIKHRIIAPKQTISQIMSEHRREFGRSFINPDANCSVAAAQTLVARADQLKAWGAQIDDWTVDECHHVLSKNLWGRAVALFPRAQGLGVTATPQRADGMGLGAHHDGVFNTMVIGPDMRTLINLGALTDYEIALPDSDFVIDDSDVTPSGDFSQQKMHKASKRSHLTGNVVTEYAAKAFGKRAICFAIDVEDAVDIANRFNAVGIPAAAVSANTPAETRAEYIRRFKDGKIWVLVNVDLFGEGFDVPACEVVIMARPTASLAVYLQQFGRALRPMAGKLYGLIIDHVGNWKRHGFPDKAHYWSLDRRDKRAKRTKDPEDVDLQRCGGCTRPYERFHTQCPYCGWIPPLPAPGGRTIELVDGDLVLLDRATLDAMRAATVLASPADVGNRAEHVAGPMAGKGAVNRQIARCAMQERLKLAIAQWAAIQRAKGRDDRSTHKRFYLSSGVDVLSALALPRADMDNLAAKVEGWCVL